uniref:Reverse transcriptase domain-containing protein n=1 Tax=Amphimedon queenslandica TaxID=400682 RepID=A0A1X7V1G4_AMPQE
MFVDLQSTPIFHKACLVPYALKAKVEAELDHLQEHGIIKPVCFADWAAPIVPVIKRDGSIRICGDYKVTANRVTKLDKYPLPHIEDLLASLSDGTNFSKLDLSHAYQNIELEESFAGSTEEGHLARLSDVLKLE